MADRNKARPGRSRKRRRAAARALQPAGTAVGASERSDAQAPSRKGGGGSGSGASGSASGKRARPSSAATGTRRRVGGGGLGDMLPMGERPRAPWHPLPLSELLIFGGAIGFFFGLQSGFTHGRAPLIVGLLALIVGTVEVTLREHLSGYRSHALILAALPVIVFDSVAVLLISPVTAAMKVALLLVDAAVFAFLYKLLRARFLDARRARVFAGGR